MLKVCVLMGGSSTEREVSLISANEIIKNLNKSKYDIYDIDIPKDGSTDWIKKLLDNPPDMVLSALHGGMGENGAVQGLLDCMRIPYIGSRVMSSAICLNKHISKIIMKSFNIPVALDILIKNIDELFLNEEFIKNEMGFPLIVKPNSGGSSIGISMAYDFLNLTKSVEAVLGMNDFVLIEKYIYGQEVICSMVEGENGLSVLPVIEIRSPDMFSDYNEKYFTEDRNAEFSNLPDFLKTMIQEIAKKAFLALDCKGYAMVDMVVCEEQITVIEVNTLPGLTGKSLIPKATKYTEGGFSGFLDKLIEFELRTTKKNYV
ncbi:MAG: D-alanine--D-alanine ligase [Defluviitaleaceae bacterium]|nr:D-alanine--D-alanine ligase [Defluviitaleaceae bacterium]